MKERIEKIINLHLEFLEDEIRIEVDAVSGFGIAKRYKKTVVDRA